MQNKAVKALLIVVGVALVVLLGLKTTGLLRTDKSDSNNADDIYDAQQIVFDYDNDITITVAGSYDKDTNKYSVLVYAKDKSGDEEIFNSLERNRNNKSYGTLVIDDDESCFYPTIEKNWPTNFTSEKYRKGSSLIKCLMVESADVKEVILCGKTYKPKTISLKDKNGKIHNYSVFFFEYNSELFEGSDYEYVYDLIDKTGKKTTVKM